MVFQEPASLSQYQILHSRVDCSSCCPRICFQLAGWPWILGDPKFTALGLLRTDPTSVSDLAIMYSLRSLGRNSGSRAGRKI